MKNYFQLHYKIEYQLFEVNFTIVKTKPHERRKKACRDMIQGL
jgi:hypothetical protein